MGWQKIEKIDQIEYSGDTYNLHIENNHNYFANGILVSNCHFAKGKELSSILEQCTNASYRIGLTGTLDNCKANINTIIGLTGSVNKLNSTKELIDRKEVADLQIKCLLLQYNKEISQEVKEYTYQQEIKFITQNEKRNRFIKNLAISMTKNTILLFNFVEHGKLLYEMIKNDEKNTRNVYLIYGGVDGDEREQIRKIVETEENCIIIASVQTTGTGVSIKNLHNIVFCQGTKSSIRLLQAIGRAIRLHNEKDKATIYDIVDDLSYKKHLNFSLKHFLDRTKIYKEQQFEHKIVKIEF